MKLARTTFTHSFMLLMLIQLTIYLISCNLRFGSWRNAIIFWKFTCGSCLSPNNCRMLNWASTIGIHSISINRNILTRPTNRNKCLHENTITNYSTLAKYTVHNYCYFRHVVSLCKKSFPYVLLHFKPRYLEQIFCIIQN